MQIKILILIYFLSISSFVFAQEIGSVKKGSHSIKYLKSNNVFSWVYLDINSTIFQSKKSFSFPNKETIYTLIMDGFKSANSHQKIVLTDSDTVIKFEFRKLKGEWLLKIRQNNLKSKTVSVSTFLNKKQIVQLFGNS